MKIDTAIIARRVTVPGVVMSQLSHSANVVEVVSNNEVLFATDGLWTENRELTLGVTTADCAPICFSDGARIGVVHAGWRGLAAGIVERMLEHFAHDSLQVHLGPHLHRFEVQRDGCFEQLHAKFGDTFFITQDDKVVFDFTAALLSVLPADTQVDKRNTATDLALPSYRHGRNDQRILTTVRFS